MKKIRRCMAVLLALCSISGCGNAAKQESQDLGREEPIVVNELNSNDILVDSSEQESSVAANDAAVQETGDVAERSLGEVSKETSSKSVDLGTIEIMDEYTPVPQFNNSNSADQGTSASLGESGAPVMAHPIDDSLGVDGRAEDATDATAQIESPASYNAEVAIFIDRVYQNGEIDLQWSNVGVGPTYAVLTDATGASTKMPAERDLTTGKISFLISGNPIGTYCIRMNLDVPLYDAVVQCIEKGAIQPVNNGNETIVAN